jgi:hypothetical protein
MAASEFALFGFLLAIRAGLVFSAVIVPRAKAAW